MLNKKFIKMFFGTFLICFSLAACITNPYSYDEIKNIDNSVVQIESNLLKQNVYGYYYKGELNEFNECKRPKFLSSYECVSEDGVRILTYSTSRNNSFSNPHLLIDGVDHKLICSSTFKHGDYCILEEDAVAAKENDS